MPIYKAVELAELNQTKEHLDSATALVAKATLNKSDLNKRLATLQEKITEREKTEKQIASAREAVEKVEQEPTDDHYNQAVTKIKELQNGHVELMNRAKDVKKRLIAQKEEAQRLTEEQKVTETNGQTSHPETASQVVLVTPTGKKYHRHICGNGQYSEATLEEAQARGLTACAKCY